MDTQHKKEKSMFEVGTTGDCWVELSKSDHEKKRKVCSWISYVIMYVAVQIGGVSLYGFCEQQRIIRNLLLPTDQSEGLSPDVILYLSCGAAVVGLVLFALSCYAWSTVTAYGTRKIILITAVTLFASCVMLVSLMMIRQRTEKLYETVVELQSESKIRQIVNDADLHKNEIHSAPYQRMERLQTQLKCCGVFGPADWSESTTAYHHAIQGYGDLPPSCSGHREGCVSAANRFADIQKKFMQADLAGIIICCIVQILVLGSAIHYICKEQFSEKFKFNFINQSNSKKEEDLKKLELDF